MRLLAPSSACLSVRAHQWCTRCPCSSQLQEGGECRGGSSARGGWKLGEAGGGLRWSYLIRTNGCPVQRFPETAECRGGLEAAQRPFLTQQSTISCQTRARSPSLAALGVWFERLIKHMLLITWPRPQGHEDKRKMIKFILVFNNQGKARLVKFFMHYVREDYL